MIGNALRTWTIFLSMFLFLYLNIFSQNLIFNPSFEVVDSCPTADSQLSRANGWYSIPANFIIENTPDLISTCAEQYPYPQNTVISPTNNLGGFQLPFSGQNYGHAIIYANPIYWPYPKIREYLSGSLIDELDSKEYCISFYVSVSDKQSCAINHFGALFSKEKYPPLFDFSTIFPISHQFDWDGGIVADTLNWQRVWGTFTASGGERYFHVGNFYDFEDTDTFQMKYGYFIYNNNGYTIKYCSGSSYYFDYFELYELPALITPNDTVLPCGGNISLQAGGADVYAWLNAQGDTLSTDSVFVASPKETTTYSLHTNQCRKKSQKQITVIVPECILNIPNIITPGGNGLNDYFVVGNLPPQSSLTILNRWGNVIYESKDYQQDWNCSLCSDGTYFYILTTPDGRQYKGTVTVVGEK